MIALACLLLVGAVSTVQAVHVHGEMLPHVSAQVASGANASDLPGGEEHCPLCVAMHSALPVSMRVEPVRTLLVECRLAQVVDRAPDSQWHFAMFSRPPPVVSL
jgi:hypothetical protein